MPDIQLTPAASRKPACAGIAIAALLLAGLCGCGSSQPIGAEPPPTEGPLTPVMRCAPATTAVADASGCATPSAARS